MLAHGGGRGGYRGLPPCRRIGRGCCWYRNCIPSGLKPMVAHVRRQRPTSFYPPAGIAGLILCALRWNPSRNMPHLENRLLWATRSPYGHVHFDHMYLFHIVQLLCCYSIGLLSV